MQNQNSSSIEKRFIVSVIALGIAALVTQIILLRDFLSVFYGNELVIGVIFANWMILTGTGSYLGRFSDKVKNKINLVVFSLILISLLPIVSVFALRFFRNIVFEVGSMVGIIQIIYSSFILLLPFCIVSGFSFTLFSHTLSEKYNSNLIPKVYSYEAFGCVIGGLLFNLVAIFFLQTFQSLIILALTVLIIVFILSLKYSKMILKTGIVFLIIILLVIIFSYDLDEITRKYLFQNQELLYYKDTPYGNLTITSQDEQKNFYENSVLLFSANDVATNEEAVHYAMVQHSNPKLVLLISGGISGAASEILKYGVDRIDYVEINPWLIEIGERFSNALANEKINPIIQDARLYIKNTTTIYDVVIMNLPEPSTAQLNRFYTDEFFKELKQKLNENAIVSLGLTSSADYLSPEARQVKSIIYNTLKNSFKNILIVPGMKDFFLASDNELDIQITKKLNEKGIHNIYVNQYYIDDNILEQRSKFILTKLDLNTTLNKDFSPISYYNQVIYWLSYFEFNYWILFAAAAVILIFLRVRMNTISFGLFTGGFSASSIEILLLIALQIIYGNVYQMTGIIITIFMAGLAIGAIYREKILAKTNIKNYIAVQISIALYALILPVVLIFLRDTAASYFFIHSIFFVLTFIISLLIGIEFSVASKLQRGKISSVASDLYSIDLIGSAIGALLVTTYLVPLLGLIKVCFIIAALNLVSASVAVVNRKKYPSVEVEC